MTSGEFKSLLLPCYRQMYATAFAILRNADDASDAVQDTMSALWQKHPVLNIPDNCQAFCCHAVRNVCIDRIRQNSRYYFDRIDCLYPLPANSATDSAVSLDTTKSYLSAILLKFKEKHRHILTLSIFSQLSNDEISNVTGESPENVRAILSRGRKKIKDCMNNEK